MNTEDKVSAMVEIEVLVGHAVEWTGRAGTPEISLHKDTEAANQAAVRHKGILHDCYIKRWVPGDQKDTSHE